MSRRSIALLIGPLLLSALPLAPGRAGAQSAAPPGAPPGSEESLRRAWDLKAEALKALQDGPAAREKSGVHRRESLG